MEPFNITVTELPSVSTGSNVTVSPAPGVTLLFTSITSDGEVNAQGGIITFAVHGYTPLPATGYNITTNASYQGYITISIDYREDDLKNFGYEEKLKIFHFNGRVWEDITTSVDADGNRVVGKSTSLSPFVVAAPVEALKVPIINGIWFLAAAVAGLLMIGKRRKN